MPLQHAEPSKPTQHANNQGAGQTRANASGPSGFAASGMLMPDNLLYLQRTVGNRAIQRMLGERQAQDVAPPLPVASKASNRAIQRKEEEELVAPSGSPAQGGALDVPPNHATVQRKKDSSSMTGAPKIQVHTNSRKAAEMGAMAYTQGTNIHVAPGQYHPNSRAGAALLKHESAHVAQQLAGRVQPTRQMNGMAVNTDKGLEREADQWADKGIAPKGGAGGQASSTTKVAQFKFPETTGEWISLLFSDTTWHGNPVIWVERLFGLSLEGEIGKLVIEAFKDQVVITPHSGEKLYFSTSELLMSATETGTLTKTLRDAMAFPTSEKKDLPEKKGSTDKKGVSEKKNISEKQSTRKQGSQNTTSPKDTKTPKDTNKNPRAQSPTKGKVTAAKSSDTGGIVSDKSTNKDGDKGTDTKPKKELLVVGSHMSGDMYGVAGALTLRPKLNVLILTDDDEDHVRTKNDMEKLFNSVKSDSQNVFVEEGLTNVNSEWQAYIEKQIWVNPKDKSDTYIPINITNETQWIRDEFAKGVDESKEKGTENEALTKIKERWIAPKGEGNEKDKEDAIDFMKYRGFKEGGRYGLVWGKQGKETHPHPQHYTSPESRKMLFQEVEETGRIAVAVGDKIEGADTLVNLTRFWADDKFPAKFKGEGRRGQLKFFHYLSEFADIVHVGMRSGILEGPALLGQKVIFLEEKDNDQAGRWEKLLDVIPTFRRVILDTPPGLKEKKLWVSRVLWQRHKSEFRHGVKEAIGKLLSISTDKQSQVMQILNEHADFVSAHGPILDLHEKLLAEAKPKTTPTPKQTPNKQPAQKKGAKEQPVSTGGSQPKGPTISIVPTISDEPTSGDEKSVSKEPPSKEELGKGLMSILLGAKEKAAAMELERAKWELEELERQKQKAKNKESGEGMNSGESGAIKQLMKDWNVPPDEEEQAQNYHMRTWHKADELNAQSKPNWVKKYAAKKLQEEASFEFMLATRSSEKKKGQGDDEDGKGEKEDDAPVDDGADVDEAQTQSTVGEETARDKVYKVAKAKPQYLPIPPFRTYYDSQLRRTILDRFSTWFVPPEQRKDKKKTVDLLLSWFKENTEIGSLAYEENRISSIGESSSKEKQDDYDFKYLLNFLGESTFHKRLATLVPGLSTQVYEEAVKRGGHFIGAYHLLCMPKQYPFMEEFIDIGISKEPLGQGKQKDVYRIQEFPTLVLAKMKKNDYFSLLSGELAMLEQLSKSGLTILEVKGVTTHLGMPAVVMRLYFEHSKDFVAKKITDFKDQTPTENYGRYEPKPPTPKEGTPESGGVKSTVPTPIESQSIKPEVIEPLSTVPQSTAPKSTLPESTISDTTLTLSTVPQIMEPIVGETKVAEQQVAQSTDKNVKDKKEEDRYIKYAKHVNKTTIHDLLALQDQMDEKKVRIKDLQFLIDKDGSVVINDPGTVQLDTDPSDNEYAVINNLIATTVHHLIREAGGLDVLGGVVTGEILKGFGVPPEQHSAVLSLLDSRYRLPVIETEEMKLAAEKKKLLKEERKKNAKAKTEKKREEGAKKLEESGQLTAIQKQILLGLYKTEKGFVALGKKFTAQDYEKELGVIERPQFVKELQPMIKLFYVKPDDAGLHLLEAGKKKAMELLEAEKKTVGDGQTSTNM